MDILKERQQTHGEYSEVAELAQSLKVNMRNSRNWILMSDTQRDALEAIANKQARILCGNPNEPDHWLDIAGYATLAKDRANS